MTRPQKSQSLRPMKKNAAADKADAPAEDSTRKFDFGELKFGADYDPKKTK